MRKSFLKEYKKSYCIQRWCSEQHLTLAHIDIHHKVPNALEAIRKIFHPLKSLCSCNALHILSLKCGAHQEKKKKSYLMDSKSKTQGVVKALRQPWMTHEGDWRVQILTHRQRAWTQRAYLIHDCHPYQCSHFKCCRSDTRTSPTATEVEKSTLGQCCNWRVCLSSRLPSLSCQWKRLFPDMF